MMNKLMAYYRRAATFIGDVRAELKKVTWPPRREVQGTTIVVLITVFAFGFYLYTLDVLFSYAAAFVTRLVRGL
jgi:preprotein translocase subunit SecE